jgi:hypothetical protein
MGKWLAAAAVYCLFAAVAGASILTFQGTGMSNWGELTTYGSDMTGSCTGSGQQGCVSEGNGFTPDIAASYESAWFSPVAGSLNYMGLWTTPSPYGNFAAAAFSYESGQGIVTLTPTNGTSVILNSFDLAGEGQDVPDQTVAVTTLSGTVLWESTGTVSANDSIYYPDIASSVPIEIQFGDTWNVGIDNINFDEVQASYYIESNWNSWGVVSGNAGTVGPSFTLTAPTYIVSIEALNNDTSTGQAPLLGSLGFIEPDGTVISWPTVGAGVNYSTDWIAYPGVLLQPGTYQVWDSDPSTWVYDTTSDEMGFARVGAALPEASGTPEPASWILAGAGLLALAMRRRSPLKTGAKNFRQEA